MVLCSEVFVLVILISSSLLLLLCESKYMVYNTSSTIVAGKLNVHLVPHTHDDVGWLKTVDQYYVGSNNSIQGACVQNVLDSLIPSLLADKNRKFIYAEQAFFQRWWTDQSDQVQELVQELVHSGQIEFINGGWCMHDEAVTHYIDMIDQTTLGHRYIKQQFGVIPRIGWQIDPFGHSAVQAYLLGAQVGFDSLFFARIDYQDRAMRRDEKKLEFVWRGSRTFGSSAEIFTGSFPEGNYEPPRGFYFELNDDSPIVQDDINLFDYNVQDRVNDFVAAALSQANVTRTNHIMWTMGTDFKYQYAHTWFRQMDKLIHYVNLDGRVNAFYSTPSIYTDAKYAADEQWPLKTDDFFPYADRANAFWTGYFTSRPAIKRYVRMMSGYLLAARQLEFFRVRSNAGPNTDSLTDALGIAQHHDGVTGTEKQHVANDYAKRLSIGYTEAEELVSLSLGFLSASPNDERRRSVNKFQQCPLLNISYCPASEINISKGKNLIVVIYNSLGWKRDDVVYIPVINENFTVHDSEGKEIESQLLPVANAYKELRHYYVQAHLGRDPTESPKYWLAFSVTVPPLGFSTYAISNAKMTGASSTKSSVHRFKRNEQGTVDIGHGNLKLTFSTEQGKLTKYVNDATLVEESIEQSYTIYSSYDGRKDKAPQNSGAYIFRPNDTFPIKPESPLTVVRGPVMNEIRQQINPWIHQTTRVYKGKDHVEVEFIVGPIPVDDGTGKEVATKITSKMETNKTFYTDSNGRDFIKRIRDYRTDWDLEQTQPIAGNYYPINLGMYVQDDKKELSVLVDRAIGGTSVEDGQIELMLHRRILLDDSRGVAEALNETVCVVDKCKGLTIQGKYYYRMDNLGEGAKWRRSFGQEIYSPLLLAFAEENEEEWKNSGTRAFSGIDPSYTLPENVAIITLQELADGKVLLRLAHLYEVGEDKDLSIPASVELKKLFPNNKIDKVTETSLTANQERSEMEKKRLKWKVQGRGGEEEEEASKVVRGGPVDQTQQRVVQLAPMEIRTFLIEFDDQNVVVFDS